MTPILNRCIRTRGAGHAVVRTSALHDGAHRQVGVVADRGGAPVGSGLVLDLAPLPAGCTS